MKLTSEALFAQKLAANEKHVRDKAVRKLRKWIAAKTSSKSSGFSKLETLKIWKGLFYCMWMSDKPVIQEELAATIGDLIHAFGNSKSALLFISCFFQTLNREWDGVDRWRVDKYMNFVRRFLAQCFEFLGRLQWQPELVEQFLEVLSKDVINPKTDFVSIGLQLHLADIYIEELAKNTYSKLSPDKLTKFFVPYCQCLASTKPRVLTRTIVKRVFEFALRLHEDSDENEDDEETETVEANGGNDEADDSDALECEEGSEDEDLGLAGNWRRTLKKREQEARSVPFPKFDFQNIGDTISGFAQDSDTKHNRGELKRLADLFWKMAKGIFDLDDVILPKVNRLRTKDIERAAQRLAEEDNNYRRERVRLKLQNLKRKKGGANTNDDVVDMFDEDDLDGNDSDDETVENDSNEEDSDHKNVEGDSDDDDSEYENVENDSKDEDSERDDVEDDSDGKDSDDENVKDRKLSKRKKPDHSKNCEPTKKTDKQPKTKRRRLELSAPTETAVESEVLKKMETAEAEKEEKEEPVIDKLMQRLLAKSKSANTNTERVTKISKKAIKAVQLSAVDSKSETNICPTTVSEESKIAITNAEPVNKKNKKKAMEVAQTIAVKSKSEENIFQTTDFDEDEKIPSLVPIQSVVDLVINGTDSTQKVESKQEPDVILLNSDESEEDADSEIEEVDKSDDLQIVYINSTPKPVALKKQERSMQVLESTVAAVTSTAAVTSLGTGESSKLKSQTGRYFPADGISAKRKKRNSKMAGNSPSEFVTPKIAKIGRGKTPADFLSLSCEDTRAATSKTKTIPIVQFQKVTPSTPAFFRVAASKVLSKTLPKMKVRAPIVKEDSPQLTKRVNFILSKNVAHADGEYMHSVKNSPSVPFDAGRTPSQGVLKINPHTPVTRRKAMHFF